MDAAEFKALLLETEPDWAYYVAIETATASIQIGDKGFGEIAGQVARELLRERHPSSLRKQSEYLEWKKVKYAQPSPPEARRGSVAL